MPTSVSGRPSGNQTHLRRLVSLKNTFSKANVLVIGNGFDLDLGLPTSYGHFLDSQQFQNELNGSQLFKRLLKVRDRQRWVDIEEELANHSSSFSGDAESFHEEYRKLKDALMDYISSIEYSEIRQNSKAAEVVRRIYASNDPMCVINFNYSDSLSYIDGLGTEFNHIRLHGSAKNQDIVFGVADSAQIKSDHIFLKKGAAKGLFREVFSHQIMNWCTGTVTFFGHSLGESDHTQFQDFFREIQDSILACDPNVTVHYHNVDSYYRLLQQIDVMANGELQKFMIERQVKFEGPDLP